MHQLVATGTYRVVPEVVHIQVKADLTFMVEQASHNLVEQVDRTQVVEVGHNQVEVEEDKLGDFPSVVIMGPSMVSSMDPF